MYIPATLFPYIPKNLVGYFGYICTIDHVVLVELLAPQLLLGAAF
jgi:hypothetical protein